jgi:hypothetical protein
MKGDLFINNIQVPDKYLTLTEGRVEFRKERRSINNTLTSDIITTKKTFTFAFDRESVWVDGAYVRSMVSLYELGGDVIFKTVEHDSTEKEYICAIKMDVSLVREWKEDNFAYSGFSFVLEEV